MNIDESARPRIFQDIPFSVVLFLGEERLISIISIILIGMRIKGEERQRQQLMAGGKCILSPVPSVLTTRYVHSTYVDKGT